MTDSTFTQLFASVLNMSLTGSIVILAVLMIRFFLRKAPRKWSYLLWLVVAFRLICPVSIAAPVSLMGAVRAPATTQGTIEYIPQIMVTPQTPAVLPVNPAPGLSIPDSVTPAPQIPPAPAPVSTMDILAVVWLVGMAIMLIYSVASYLRLRRRLFCAILLNDNVWQSDRVQSPFILGLIRPRIYLPFGLDGQTLRFVLSHEHCHLKRGDHIMKPLAFLLLALHWFNPLCWLAFHLMGRDMEMSCDEQVLAQENGDCKAYSTALLSFAANRRFPAPGPLAFGEGEVRPRITNALNWKAPKVWVTAAAGVLCVAVLLLCALNPKFTEPERMGRYVDVQDFINQTMAAEKTARYFKLGLPPRPDGGAATAEAKVTGTKLVYLEKKGALSGLDPNGVLEAWESFYLLALDVDPSQVDLPGGQYGQDGWYNLDGSYNVVALRYEDGSYDILNYEAPGGDNVDFLGGRTYEEALHDWYVKQYGLTDVSPPFVVDWIARGRYGTIARRHDGADNCSIYIPIDSWDSSGTDSWSSAYDTGAGLSIVSSNQSLSEQLRQAQLEGRTVMNEGNCYRIDYEYSSTFRYPHPTQAYTYNVQIRWPAAPSETAAPTPEQEREELFKIARSFRIYSGRTGTEDSGSSLGNTTDTPGDPDSDAHSLSSYDFDHDGVPEVVQVVKHDTWFELQIKRADGTMLWSDEAHTAHMGYNSLFACTLDGEDYLLQYKPTMYQGSCDYSYRLFSFDAKGNVLLNRESAVSFDTNWGMPNPYHRKFNAVEVADFMDEVNGLLANSKLLLNTDTALEGIDPENPQDIPWWIRDETFCSGYVYDNNKTLRENLMGLERFADNES